MKGAMAFSEPIIMKPTAITNVKQYALMGSSLAPRPFKSTNKKIESVNEMDKKRLDYKII